MNKRLFGLDNLRAVAILLVVFGHSIWLVYGIFPTNSIFDTLFIFFASISGQIGVEIFFVLSGYLIGNIFVKEFVLNTNNAHWQSVKLFLIKRWFRTLPNYYLYILIYLMIYWLMSWDDIESFSWKYLFFVQNLVNTGPGFLHVGWSLAVEEWFYLLMPLFFYSFFLFFRNKQMSFFVTILFLFLIPFLSRIIYVSNHFEEVNFTLKLGAVTLYRLDSIAYGVCFAMLWNKLAIQNLLLKYKKMLFRFSLALFMIFLIFMLVFIAKPIQNPILVLISYPILTLIITFSLPFMITYNSKKSNQIEKSITFISLISYSLYLSHPIFIKFFEYLKQQYNPSLLICCLFWILTIASSIIFSYCTFILCEKKFLHLRDKIILKIS